MKARYKIVIPVVVAAVFSLYLPMVAKRYPPLAAARTVPGGRRR